MNEFWLSAVLAAVSHYWWMVALVLVLAYAVRRSNPGAKGADAWGLSIAVVVLGLVCLWGLARLVRLMLEAPAQ